MRITGMNLLHKAPKTGQLEPLSMHSNIDLMERLLKIKEENKRNREAS